MKQRISPFQFSNYRDFLRTALKEKGFSYRSFTARHGDVVSFMMLAQTLSKGRSGSENKPMRNLSPETVARLGKTLKLRDDEISYLVLLKLENDCAVLPGPFGSTYQDTLKALIREQKSKIMHGTIGVSTSKKRFSQASETIAEFLDLLPDRPKSRLTRELIVEGKGILSRQKRRAGVRNLASIIQKLESLVSMGSA